MNLCTLAKYLPCLGHAAGDRRKVTIQSLEEWRRVDRAVDSRRVTAAVRASSAEPRAEGWEGLAGGGGCGGRCRVPCPAALLLMGADSDSALPPGAHCQGSPSAAV